MQIEFWIIRFLCRIWVLDYKKQETSLRIKIYIYLSNIYSAWNSTGKSPILQ